MIKPLFLNFSLEEAVRVARILIDKDETEALAFLKECLKPQLDQATRDH